MTRCGPTFTSGPPPGATRRIGGPGERYGRMVTTEHFGWDSGGPLWYCHCDCGELEIRPVDNLRSSVLHGSDPMCSKCRGKALVARTSALHKMKVHRTRFAAARWKQVFRRCGSLYPSSAYDTRFAASMYHEMGEEVADLQPGYPLFGLEVGYAAIADLDRTIVERLSRAEDAERLP